MRSHSRVAADRTCAHHRPAAGRGWWRPCGHVLSLCADVALRRSAPRRRLSTPCPLARAAWRMAWAGGAVVPVAERRRRLRAGSRRHGVGRHQRPRRGRRLQIRALMVTGGPFRAARGARPRHLAPTARRPARAGATTTGDTRSPSLAAHRNHGQAASPAYWRASRHVISDQDRGGARTPSPRGTNSQRNAMRRPANVERAGKRRADQARWTPAHGRQPQGSESRIGPSGLPVRTTSQVVLARPPGPARW